MISTNDSYNLLFEYKNQNSLVPNILSFVEEDDKNISKNILNTQINISNIPRHIPIENTLEQNINILSNYLQQMEVLNASIKKNLSIQTNNFNIENIDSLINHSIPLPTNKLKCNFFDNCNHSNCKYIHDMQWYKKTNHYLRVCNEHKKQCEYIEKFITPIFPQLNMFYNHILEQHKKIIKVLTNYIIVYKSDNTHLQFLSNFIKSEKEKVESNFVNKKIEAINHIPKNKKIEPINPIINEKEDEQKERKRKYNNKKK
jgi:hypothetical protein